MADCGSIKAAKRRVKAVEMSEDERAFRRLAGMEPMLRDVERSIVRMKDALRRKRHLCANGVWYGFGKYPQLVYDQRVNRYVGPHRCRFSRHPDPAAEAELRSPAALDAAAHYLWSIMPPCRGCLCS